MERFYQSLTSLRNDALAPSSESTEQKQDEPSTSRAGAAEPDSTNDTGARSVLTFCDNSKHI